MQTEIRAVVPEGMEAGSTRRSYSPGVIVGELLFVSGQVGRTAGGTIPDDPEEQFVVAFENLAAVLRDAGASFADVVEMTTYHTSFDDFERFAEVRARYVTTAPYPAWTGIGVSALALPGLLVEIKATARL
jgi:enamine deaminase RidA (YjgF/YER057c/UK114 family)